MRPLLCLFDHWPLPLPDHPFVYAVHFALCIIVFSQCGVFSDLGFPRCAGVKTAGTEKWPIGSRCALHCRTDSDSTQSSPIALEMK